MLGVVATATVSPTRARARLDRSTVVETARDLLDEEGIEAFSMSRLGHRLGVTAMALYRHVHDRADLERAVAELVLADLGGTAHAGDWAAGVAAWMHGVHDHWRRHPWLGGLLGNRAELSPEEVHILRGIARAIDERCR